ncbi:hypothetical protein [Nocardiopsis aegyptia]|uniref:Uncharacterized membrane protein YidH (DUF202 family) n=1 Tax=Nocardiopsis aegyptia TaxID=220378 RepID=A0A7Z0JBV7_9ACTN|nr:hypothetical protein [Nocardiopsis aegyptia]NYJ35824.1 uncharacterized membrane protein YidH (DUF202 family) [Nocardiopsis aegyptia]
MLGWTGAGLIAGGILLAGVNIVRFSPRGEPLTTPQGGGLWWITLGLGLVVLGVVLQCNGRDPDAGPAKRRSWGYTAFLLVTGALCLAVACVGFSPDLFVVTAGSDRVHRADSPGTSTLVVTLVIALGMVLMAAAGSWPRLQPQSRSMPPAVGGLALVLVIELGLRAAGLYQATEHTVAGADAFPDVPVPVPTDVAEAGWTWEPPADTDLVAVEPGAFGP